MTKPKSGLGRVLAEQNTREVAAMITFTKTPTIKADYNHAGTGLMAQLLNTIENAPGLIVRRPWFGFDKMLVDDFSDRVKRTFLDNKQISEEMERIAKNPALYTGDFEDEIEQDARIELRVPTTSLISIDLSEASSPIDDIRMKVPLQRLQQFLVRAYKATEQNGTAQMTRVKVAYAPRFDNKDAPVADLLAPDLE